ncbi:MAG: dinitrogenase iron-molybdenum cofactor biosynthesis protein [Oscillatoriales cyanobacterium RM2_1_1]|nr:dinitrogenase iron-molybdenum cofactor biosynthesis protein [Oscillatoriales cyanobacterium SM2_3_0]NJO45420.1 dinitrogenase iron-molybdenum cofactor biosynthesis protein [Oscillatoriales cyanobacterium RM2_1_1]
MSGQSISQEVALRIGLAARVLPEVTIGDLIEALQNFTGNDITEEKLSKITVTNLKTAFGQTYSLDGEEDGEDNRFHLSELKEAVKILWGEVDEEDNHFPVEPYEEGDMPNSIRIAVASNNEEELDGHFGSCLRYLIYQLSTTEIRLIDVRSTFGVEELEDKNRHRVNLIKDCQVCYVVSVGGPAAAKVVQANIYPMKVPEGGSAREVLGKLQRQIATAPPPWFAKLIGIEAGQRLKNYS